MKLYVNKTIKSLFADGFEELRVEYLHSGKTSFLHKKDFESGGSLYAFKEYTIGRFENEFNCVTWIG